MSDLACEMLSCEIEELKKDLNIIFLSRLVNVASYTVLIYDYLLTLGSEVLIWRSPNFNIGKILFLSIRYFTLFVMIFIVTAMFTDGLSTETFVISHRSQDRCLAWVRFHWVAGLVIIMLSELTLQVRIYAMYGKTRTILLFMIFTFLATFGCILMFISRLFTIEEATFFHPIPDNELFICLPYNVPHYFLDILVPLFVHEFILLALAVNKGIQSVKTHRKSGYVSRLMVFLVKGSVLYYISVFGVSLSLELVWAIGGVNYIELPFGLAIVIVSTMCQRMLLQIRNHFKHHTEVIATSPNWSASGQGSEEVVHVVGLRSGRGADGEEILLSTFPPSG